MAKYGHTKGCRNCSTKSISVESVPLGIQDAMTRSTRTTHTVHGSALYCIEERNRFLGLREICEDRDQMSLS